jgi:ribonuclease E
MRKIILIAIAALATTSAHAELSGATVAAAAPAAQPAPAVVQPAPVAQPAPVQVQAAPVQPIIQTTNPQAQRVLKELQAHGLIKLQPAVQPAPAAPANVVTAPAVTQTQAAQPQATQAQPVQAQAPPQPIATAVQQPATQPAAAPAPSSVSVRKPVVHVDSRRDADEAKARRIAARYGIHW